MDLATRFRVAAVTADILPLTTAEDLFLLFCNEGRKDKVVLGLTDTMYKKRLSTAGELNSMTKGGFKNLLRQADAVPADVDTDHLFMRHLGYTDPKAPKFELQFDHWLDAMQAVAVALYRDESPNGALRALFAGHLAPLAHAVFGASLIEAHAASDAGSVASGRPAGGGGTRVTSLCLTPKGTVALPALEEGVPAVPMLVTTAPHAGPLHGSALAVPHSGGATLPRRPLSLRLASGAATPDNGAASVAGGGGGTLGSATRTRPLSGGFYSPPPLQPSFGATSSAAAQQQQQLRSPPPAYSSSGAPAPYYAAGSPSAGGVALRGGSGWPASSSSSAGAGGGLTSPLRVSVPVFASTTAVAAAAASPSSGGGSGGGGAPPLTPLPSAAPSPTALAAQLALLLAQLSLQGEQLAAERQRSAALEGRLVAALQAAAAPPQQPQQQQQHAAAAGDVAAAEGHGGR